jgi:hypothetical protein
MTPQRYAQVIGKLGLSQVKSAEFLGYDPRTIRRWVSSDLPIPKVVAMLLELMVRTEATAEEAEQFASAPVPTKVPTKRRTLLLKN